MKKKILVGGHMYLIRETVARNLHKLMKYSDGVTEFSSLKIWLKKGMAPSKQEQTLSHELIHALLEESGAGSFIKDGQEEEFARSLENTFWQFLKNNPNIFDSPELPPKK